MRAVVKLFEDVQSIVGQGRFTAKAWQDVFNSLRILNFGFRIWTLASWFGNARLLGGVAGEKSS